MAENAAESRRQFNNVPIGFKGFRETHTGTYAYFSLIGQNTMRNIVVSNLDELL